MQLEELLDKLKEKTNKQKHDIAIKQTCNVREFRRGTEHNASK